MHKQVRGVDNCLWLNSDIKRDMRERDYFLMKARKTRFSENWAKYRYFRNLVTGKIKKAKEADNRRVIEENSHDGKAFWRTVKKLLPGENKEASPNIKIGNNFSSDKRSITNAFNKYFTNAVTRLVDSLEIPVASVCSGLAFRSFSSPATRRRPIFQFTEVTESFVLNQLKGLKTKKAAGLDDIPQRLLKDSAAIITKPLTVIFNASLRQSKVSDAWKAARVIPLFKKGKRECMDNYRLISILPTVSKLLERAVHVQLYGYLREQNILSPYQCSFRKQHSTKFAALSLLIP